MVQLGKRVVVRGGEVTSSLNEICLYGSAGKKGGGEGGGGRRYSAHRVHIGVK